MRFNQAAWRGPVPNESPGQMVRPILGLVLHIEQGSESGTDAWFHNPGAQASAHFGNPKSGPLDQWVDTADMAWAEMNGNPRWVSVEHEGNSGDSLTASQVENDAQLLAWLRATENVPIAMSNDPSTPGLGYHAMGGQAWGGHLDCPGQPIINQRPAILSRAAQIAGGPTPTGGTTLPGACIRSGTTDQVWKCGPDGGVFAYGGAPFYGSLPGLKVTPAAPIIDIESSWSGNGYYLLGGDGGVFAFGDAADHGSYPGLPANERQGSRSFLRLSLHWGGNGYTLVSDDGGHYAFGA